MPAFLAMRDIEKPYPGICAMGSALSIAVAMTGEIAHHRNIILNGTITPVE